MRVHELAKKHSKTSKELLEIIVEMGITATALSKLDDDIVAKIEDKINGKEKKQEVRKNSSSKPESRIDREENKTVKKDGGKSSEVRKDDLNSGSEVGEKGEKNKMGEKKIGDKMEKRETKAKPKKIDIIEDAIDMDVVDRKKAKKPKIEVIAEEVETPAVVSKDNKKAKGFEKTKQKPNFVKEKEEVVVEKPVEKKEEPEIKIIRMGSEISLKELAEKLHHNPTEIIKKLFMKGQMFTINSVLSFEMAEEIAIEYEFLVEKEEEKGEESYGDMFNLEEEDSNEDLIGRPPVITIMGHVDHGKTSLLDAIRKTAVAAGEAGGITQKIGAYQVVKNGKKITFIDTPGHEAFTDMRARGASVTDIAILVVAADDGVMPQTIEAISHAKAANVPIIVAINKIDKPGAEPARVKQELLEYELVSVEWGGDTEFVEVSAKALLNLDTLLETILITSELLELKANPNKRAKGVILESRLDPKMGPVADVLIQEGTLKVGDVFVAGDSYGKVRALINERGDKINKVEPAQPAEIIGFNTVPSAGEIVYGIKNEKQSKKIVEEIQKLKKIKELQQKKPITLEDIHSQMETEKLKDLKLIVKADSKGSVEALKESLMKLSNEEVLVNIIHSSAGAITEGDIKLAEASNAIIIGYNVSPTTKARVEAERENVDVRIYNVIYHITEEIEKALKGMLAPQYKEVYQGRIEIKQLFKVTKIGTIGGAVVLDGRVKKDSEIRLLRNGIIVHEGKLGSLKRFTNDASEVIAGQECGITVDGYNDIKEGDVVEAYIMQEVKRD